MPHPVKRMVSTAAMKLPYAALSFVEEADYAGNEPRTGGD